MASEGYLLYQAYVETCAAGGVEVASWEGQTDGERDEWERLAAKLIAQGWRPHD